MGAIFIEQFGHAPLIGSVSAIRDEVYYLKLTGNNSVPDSRYVINYVIKVSNSSNKLSITDKTKTGMNQIVYAPQYLNVITSYNPSNGEIKIEMKNITKNENYMIQVAFQMPPQDMFEGTTPITSCTPTPSFGYSGELQINIDSFKLKYADKLNRTEIYAWVTGLATNATVVSSKPVAGTYTPIYGAPWVYKNATTAFNAHQVIYKVKIASNSSIGDVLFTTWIESHYHKSFTMSADPVFDGAKASFSDGECGYALQYDYTIHKK
jgi:hypothetical protein